LARWRAIFTAFIESTVNVVVSKHLAKKQRMQWSEKGAHLPSQTRTKALEVTLREMFVRRYPAMAANDQITLTLAAA
jgi:hypothetical protein